MVIPLLIFTGVLCGLLAYYHYCQKTLSFAFFWIKVTSLDNEWVHIEYTSNEREEELHISFGGDTKKGFKVIFADGKTTYDGYKRYPFTDFFAGRVLKRVRRAVTR